MSALNKAVLDNKGKNLKAFFIFLDSTGKAIEPKLTAIAKKTNSYDLGLTYLSPKDPGVAAYKVNLDPAVKNTVMLYRNRKVTAKFVNLSAKAKDLAALKASIAKLVR